MQRLQPIAGECDGLTPAGGMLLDSPSGVVAITHPPFLHPPGQPHNGLAPNKHTQSPALLLLGLDQNRPSGMLPPELPA